MLRRRGKGVYLYKRVPKRYESVEARRHIWLSLRTDSMSEAESKASPAWQQLVAGWEVKLSGDTSDAEKRFESARELAREKTFGKSADQLRKWKNPRIKAVRAFIDVVGDKGIAAITGDDMLDFRAWWLDRIENEGLKPSSANKDLIHLGDVLKTVSKMKRLNLVLPLSDLSFKEGEQEQRPPFSDDWIRSKIMASEALAGLNKDARCILLAMINTGARPSELAALTR